jgi:fructose-bisphosphate aldolase / 6-deoxy-5-ketofructose 1-phosphate synthase
MLSLFNRYRSKQIPLTVPFRAHQTYMRNLMRVTKNTNKIFLFAFDQKVEHLNQDVFGTDLPIAIADPAHPFMVASQSPIGAFATHLGLVARYGMDYKDVPYIIKLNGKTNIVPPEHQDPLSLNFISVEDVVAFRRASQLSIVGVGLTVYLGSRFEGTMLAQAAQAVVKAHRHGLLAVVWIYPRGAAVTNQLSPDIIAGAAGVGLSLGADFVKVNPPLAPSSHESAQFLKQATVAAGRTGLICSGGALDQPEHFLYRLHDQLHVAGARGCAVGRNIFQKPLPQAIAFAQAIGALVYDNASVAQAASLLK